MPLGLELSLFMMIYFIECLSVRGLNNLTFYQNLMKKINPFGIHSSIGHYAIGNTFLIMVA